MVLVLVVSRGVLCGLGAGGELCVSLSVYACAELVVSMCFVCISV